MHNDNKKAEFEQVLKDELDMLDELRDGISSNTEDSGYKRAHDSDLTGLAFSGGGIRSATFNLGVIQALSNYGLLARFDYLSTVSGGGYIGGWLSALLHRKTAVNGVVNQQAVEAFQKNIKPHPEEGDTDKTVGFSPVEHKAVRYLRRYSNYLTPRLGLGGDMFAVISIFLRNFTLMQLSLVSLVTSILLLAHTIAAGSKLFNHDVSGFLAGLQAGWPAWLHALVSLSVSAWPFALSALALSVSVWWAGRLMAERRTANEKRTGTSRAVHYSVILPSLLAAWWFSAAIVTHSNTSPINGSMLWQLFFWILLPAFGYAGAWWLGFYSRQRAIPGKKNTLEDAASRLTLLLATAVSGLVFGSLLFAAHCYFGKSSADDTIDIWHAVGFGTPLFLLGLSFVVTLHIGAVRRVFSEDDREWLARLGGFVLLYAAGWALIFALVLYATPFVDWLAGGGLVALATWAAGSGLGALFARGSSTDGSSDSSSWKGITALFAPWVFLGGLTVIVTYATQAVLFKFLLPDADAFGGTPDSDFFIAIMHTLQQLHELPAVGTLLALLVAGTLFYVLSRRLDINLFSLHALYCNRLARAYLGASRAGNRQPNPFTGFDINDDLPFADLAKQRPIHIINTAINMTGGDDLAWQTRRAASFALTPRWAGYETLSSQGVKLGTYRPTAEYAGGRPIGTWVAVSGAAASPNMGYHTSAAVAALMTAFNLRLGRWCGNPDPVDKQSTVWKQESPKFAAKPILAELSGSANTQADWVNLTDGGHFENLGVYELIRRRCRFIVVTDAGCDPEHKFEDLANLLRKCWTDFGVNIRFDNFEAMHLKKDSRCCNAYGVVGSIEYKDGGPDGAIIYLKASMTGSEWPDIRQYADSHKDFPHETTADQFFDENQFEAYRHLGYKVAAMVAVTLEKLLQQPVKNVSTEDIVSALLKNRKILEL